MIDQIQKKKTMKQYSHRARYALLSLLVLTAVFATVTISGAQVFTPPRIPVTVDPDAIRTLAALRGPWAATIVGNTGCGLGTMYVTFSLDAFGRGAGTATVVTHAQCADGTTSGLDFNIFSLNPNGSGTAGLSCGPGCGWELNIQVARSGEIFNLVDVSRLNPNNYIEGTAIRQ